jgi:hypothetical protein
MKKLIKMTPIEAKQRSGERGNVLFLILIAVALFAALSYAVTSSSRSGGNDANEETNLVNSSTITQYPASLRTAMIRMQVSDAIDIDQMEFNEPADFANCLTVGVVGDHCVFHPDGGGATWVPGPAEVMAGGAQVDWVINAENEIDGVGTTAGSNAPTTDTAEIIAFLPGIRRGICQKINEELGIASASADGIPVETADVNFATHRENSNGTTGGLPAFVASGTTGTIDGSAGELVGQAFGCFQQPAGTFIYYHALIEQ